VDSSVADHGSTLRRGRQAPVKRRAEAERSIVIHTAVLDNAFRGGEQAEGKTTDARSGGPGGIFPRFRRHLLRCASFEVNGGSVAQGRVASLVVVVGDVAAEGVQTGLIGNTPNRDDG
jgi:hypothetical protein